LNHIVRNLKASHADSGAGVELIEEILKHEGANASATDQTKAKQAMFGSGARRTRTGARSGSCALRLRSIPRLLATHNREKDRTPVILFLESIHFTIGMSVILILNAFFILLEQTLRKGDNYHNSAWIGLETAFIVIFTLEFIVKFIGDKCYYYLDSWNLFDFFLLLISYFGLIMELIAGSANEKDGDGGDVSNEARIFRFNRLFRVLRVLRLFRLFKFSKILMAKLSSNPVSFTLAEHLKTITICRAFVRAHLHSQQELLKFFGTDGQPSCVECTRCLLESQEEVYKACAIAAAEADQVDPKTLDAMVMLRENIATTGKLSSFVLEAHEKGVISGREAETITHALDDHIREFCLEMKRTASGRKSKIQLAREEFPTESEHLAPPLAGDANGETRGLKDPSGSPDSPTWVEMSTKRPASMNEPESLSPPRDSDVKDETQGLNSPNGGSDSLDRLTSP